jgi:hypothetical protein
MGKLGLTNTTNPNRKDGLILPLSAPAVKPLVSAAVLLLARSLCQTHKLAHPSVADILSATKVTRSRAYEVSQALRLILPSLIQPCGRPPGKKTQPSALSDSLQGLTTAVVDYLMHHPGCVHICDTRRVYSDDFRHFIVELRARYGHVTLDDFAQDVCVPVGTLKPWLAQPVNANNEHSSDATIGTEAHGHGSPPDESFVDTIEVIATAWKSWKGTFSAFVEYVRNELRLQVGHHSIARILEACGLRTPNRRSGRSPDEKALRNAFETFFPGAQWVGDGKLVQVVIDGQTFPFNLELHVDAHTGAWVGLDCSTQEDSAAVLDAWDGALTTTGAAPLALLLDNNPANHTEQVDEVLGNTGTLRIRATKQRPQNKAHVEGAFGLFAQQVPELKLDTSKSKQEIAKTLLSLVATTFARAINRRPRADRNGLSRADLYAEEPTEEQIQQAKQALRERLKKQERARETRESRQRPVVKALLDDHFQKLGLIDPERHIRLTIGNYPLDSIVDAIAIFSAKKVASTLPEGADGRYLLGIVRNLTAQREGEEIASNLIQHRIEARELAITMLESQRLTICDSQRTDENVINDCLLAAFDAKNKLDEIFWLTATADHIRTRQPNEQLPLYHVAARRINATFRVPPWRRQNFLRFLAERVVPIN